MFEQNILGKTLEITYIKKYIKRNSRRKETSGIGEEALPRRGMRRPKRLRERHSQRRVGHALGIPLPTRFSRRFYALGVLSSLIVNSGSMRLKDMM